MDLSPDSKILLVAFAQYVEAWVKNDASWSLKGQLLLGLGQDPVVHLSSLSADEVLTRIWNISNNRATKLSGLSYSGPIASTSICTKQRVVAAVTSTNIAMHKIDLAAGTASLLKTWDHSDVEFCPTTALLSSNERLGLLTAGGSVASLRCLPLLNTLGSNERNGSLDLRPFTTHLSGTCHATVSSSRDDAHTFATASSEDQTGRVTIQVWCSSEMNATTTTVTPNDSIPKHSNLLEVLKANSGRRFLWFKSVSGLQRHSAFRMQMCGIQLPFTNKRIHFPIFDRKVVFVLILLILWCLLVSHVVSIDTSTATEVSYNLNFVHGGKAPFMYLIKLGWYRLMARVGTRAAGAYHFAAGVYQLAFQCASQFILSILVGLAWSVERSYSCVLYAAKMVNWGLVSALWFIAEYFCNKTPDFVELCTSLQEYHNNGPQ
ncbi:hypothetical protein FRC02_002087 [Tulasnella sp. 418]|nr:hypothetical protein FRC02_002087 [Tulasnella sp. 418]